MTPSADFDVSPSGLPGCPVLWERDSDTITMWLVQTAASDPAGPHLFRIPDPTPCEPPPAD